MRQSQSRNVNQLIASALIAALLGACSSLPVQINPPEERASGLILTLETTAQDTQAGLEQRYGGEMLAFEPNAGFAILHTLKQPASSDTHVKSVQMDEETQLPETQTGSSEPQLKTRGSTSWGSGSHAWGSGITAWSGGWATWGSGIGAWSGGVGSSVPALPSANNAAWEQIKLREAQQLARRLGEGVKVAVIDTGLDLEHPIFRNRLAPKNEWKDFVDGDLNPQEVSGGNGYGHGTAVAGIILQVAPRATILPIRVLGSDGGGRTVNVISGIAHAVRMGAQIINVSVGTDGFDVALFEICKYANKRGVRIVASAGNSGLKNGVTSPAQFSWLEGTKGRTIGIGSVNSSDSLSGFSAYGRGLYAVAPGEKIATAFPNHRVTLATGTSFAAPLFTGALALVESELPSISKGIQLEQTLWSSLNFAVSDKIKLEKDVNTLSPRLQLDQLLRSLTISSEKSNLDSLPARVVPAH